MQKFKSLLRHLYLKFKFVIYGLSTDSQERNWGVIEMPNHVTPRVSKETLQLLKRNNAFYVMKSKETKSCCLTFDCEENGDNADYILDLLAEKDIKATFFVTQKFIMNFPRVVTRMKYEGHIVGNHTAHHSRLALLTKKKIIQELSAVEKTMKDFTGYDIDRVFRFPFGAYSIRSLNIVNKCGYATFFWSYALPIGNPQCENLAWALGWLANFHHSGMILLFHSALRSDRELLPHYINFLECQYYRFIPVTTM